MKTLVKNSVSIMMLNDDMPVKLGEYIEIGDPVRMKINNLDGLITLHENVTPPNSYQPKRYCFDGENWSYNYDWRNQKLTAAKR